MTKTRTEKRTSSLIAALVAGSWRKSPPAPKLSSEELDIIAPLLIGSGGGALAFWKIRGTSLEDTDAGQELKQAYRLYTLHASIHEIEIRKVLGLLARVGVEPILVKGWSMARQYPEPALRPYGDIDLFVRPEECATAHEALSTPEGRKFFVDLHRGAEHLCDQPFEDLWARSRTVDVDELKVRVLAPEDHLRILCVHFLHHGAWRPAGLCDIGLLVESSGASFDWDICLTSNKKRARWVECTVGLAHRLLLADISATPFSLNAIELPRWLVPTVLKEWENPVSVDHVVPPPLANRLTHPIETMRAIHRRWPPNPIQATIVMNGSFDDRPRIFYQATNFLSRSAKFLHLKK